MSEINVSIIIPAYNNEKTIGKTLDKIFLQDYDLGKIEVIVIDDHSFDSTRNIISNYSIDHVYNGKNLGLAKNLNKGILKSKYSIIVTLHADVIPLNNDWLNKLILPLKNTNIIATCSLQHSPMFTKRKLSLWEKMIYVNDNPQSALNNKADGYKKEILTKIGMFDENTYRTAGEDEDIALRLKKYGEVYSTSAEVLHDHNFNNKKSIFKQIIYKESSFGMSGGALRRKYPFYKPGGYIYPKTKSFYYDGLFRALLFCSLIIPYIQLLSMMILFYSALKGIKIFYQKEHSLKILVYPFFNIIRYFSYSVGYFIGFIRGRQV
jgi:glycosyltransferase involved in cell wall biosynthesis